VLEISNRTLISALIAFIIAIGTICWALSVYVRNQRRQLRTSRNTLTNRNTANATTTSTRPMNIPSFNVFDDSKNYEFEEHMDAINIHRLIGKVVERELVDTNNDDIEAAAGNISTTVHFGNEIVTLVQSNDTATIVDADDHNGNITTTTDTTCVICLCDFVNGDSVYRNDPDSTCHHMFHESCIRKWIRQQQQQQSTTKSTIRPVCPCCRYPIHLPN
jgi:hypothetical protein